MTVKELRAQTGMSQRDFADYFNIPFRTLQGWERAARNPPSYVVSMMERIIKLEMGKQEA